MEIKPFKGFRYNPEVVGDAGMCIAPPYDVIDPDQQQRLHEQSEYNIVRVIKGMKTPNDDENNNVYTRAAEALQENIRQGALKQDVQESIYVYAQDFTIDGTMYRRSGFIALGKLEGYEGSVKPHEQTLAGPKADRLNLTRATRTQIGQIFMMYSEPEKKIDGILEEACRGQELLRHTDEDEVTHRLFAVTDSEQIVTVKEVMTEKVVFIADGHHRYETAVNYYNETKNPAAAYQMMTFVNMHNKGLIVLPTHRLIKNVADFEPSGLIGQMNQYFDVARMGYEDMVEKKAKREMMQEALHLEFETGEHAFGMYFNDGAFYVATLRDQAAMDTMAENYGPAWRKLDVAILHKLILEKMLGIDEEALTKQTNVEYIKDFGEATLRAIDKVDSEQSQGLFFMNPTRVGDIEAVVAEGAKMPQKSTFFFPKIFSGLVLNVLD
jgi:uncharacterized protein (DUF1015 family)